MFSNVIQNVSTETLWGIIVVMGVILVFLLWEHFYIRAQLQFKQERYWWVLGASDMYIFEYDILADELRLSDHFAALLGVPSHVFQFTKVVRNANEAKLERGLGVVDCVLQHDDYKSLDTVSLKRADGSIGMFRVRCNSFRDSQGKIAFKTGILVDVTREVREEETLRAKAEIDGLTGIYNSSTIKYLIEKSLDAGMNGKSGAFVMFDIDHFKTINDTYGHQAGDKVLQAIAKSVQSIIRDSDIFGRLGGDEFCVFLTGVPGYEFLCDFCKRLNDIAVNCMAGTDLDIMVTISVGGIIVREGDAFVHLYERGDKALYEAKHRGRNTNCVTA